MVAAADLPQFPTPWDTTLVEPLYTKIARLMNRSSPEDKNKLKTYQRATLQRMEDKVDQWEEMKKDNPYLSLE